MTSSIAEFLAGHPAVARVRVVATQGSTPRETGAEMLVAPNACLGTIGGGVLEFEAIARARAILADRSVSDRFAFTLGPDSGQCCGGQATIDIAVMDAAARETACAQEARLRSAQPVVHIFGAGHVGRALARALVPLPFATVLVDTRADALEPVIEGIGMRCLAMPEQIVRDAPAGSAFVILTHDHALDFLIATEALARGDAAYVGMIGSKTKRAVFANAFRRDGGSDDALTRLICPIGANATSSKEPAVIAAFVAAELAVFLLAPARQARYALQVE